MPWRLSFACTVFLIASGATAMAADEDFVPFPVRWNAAGRAAADLSFLLDAPAGKTGRVRIADGHLVRGDGQRLRLWGLNATMAAGLPAQEHAPGIARRLAEAGINCVRFHFLDVLAPRGLIAANRDDTQHLDPAQLDRLDTFIAELKKCGIYSDLNLNVAHPYKPGDGVRDSELLGFAKALTYFDPRLIELQKDYARQFLTHRNPYTGSSYTDEPAVALVEIFNENSLVESWVQGRLLGRNTTRHPGTWTDIPASYEQDLTRRYNAWLNEHIGAAQRAALRAEAGTAEDAPLPRLQPREFAKASPLRFQTEASFYMDIERRYFEDMARFLRDELKVQAPLIGSSDHNHGQSGSPHLSLDPSSRRGGRPCLLAASLLHARPEDGPHDGIPDRQHADGGGPAAFHGGPARASAVAGKPYTVSEVNHPFPAENASEGIPILAAYAAFQDWDGIFWYTLGHADPVAAAPARLEHFDMAPDPVKMAQLRGRLAVPARGCEPGPENGDGDVLR